MTAELLPVDGPANIPSLRTLGTGPNQALPGNTVLGGGGADAFKFVFSQGAPATVWNVTHNLAGFPNVTVVDSAGTQCEGDVQYIDANNVTLTFSAPFSGEAYFS